MDPDFTLAIPRGLDQSILLTILIGLVVMLALTETLGWVFVGVVVPGYLASIMAIQPLAGIAVMVDAILTFVIARGVAMLLERVGSVVDFFGRERFFLIVLVSVLVRQQTQSQGLPRVGPWVADTLGISGDVSLGFYSLGLVLVPLLANVLWKLDLKAGLFHVAAAVTATYLILTWSLLPFTTLSYSALELTYENAAIDFLGNAKGYIILLFTAYLAAHLNLRYGWDYNGVLVPSLLALLWLTPTKLAMSLLEACILFLAVRSILRLPGLRTLNLEGPRKMAFVFTIGLTFKWAVGTVVGPRFPDIKITDLYGFGYLLPSLLALKMLQKRAIRPVLMPTAVTSLLGFAGASVLGFALELAFPLEVPPRDRLDPVGPTRLLRSVDGVAALGQMRAMEASDSPPTPAELVAYQRAWESIANWVDAPSDRASQDARRDANRLGLRVHPMEDRIGPWPSFAVFEDRSTLSEPRGWETAVVTPGAPGPVIEVPYLAANDPTAELAAVLCRRLHCRALVIGGRTLDEPSGMATAFQVIHTALRRFPTVVIVRDESVPRGEPVLSIGAEIPESLDLARLWPGGARLDWSEPPHVMFGWGRPGLTLLRIRGADMFDRIRARTAPVPVLPTLATWWRQHVHGTHEGRYDYVPPARSELAFLDLMLARPALAARPDLALLASRAATIGYDMVTFDDCGQHDRCAALFDRSRGGWASLVFRPSSTASVAFTIPRPHRHHGTAELGLEMWTRARGRALVVSRADHGAGSHPADPLLRGNVETSYLAFHQAIDSQLHRADGLILAVAGFNEDQPLSTDIVVGLGQPLLDGDRIPPSLASFLALEGLLAGASHRFADGSLILHKLTGAGTPPMEYSLALGHAETAILWVAPWIRNRYLVRQHRGEIDRLERVGLSAAPSRETRRLLAGIQCGTGDFPPVSRDDLDDAIDYASSRNVHILRELVRKAAANDVFSIGSGWGIATGRPFLLLEWKEGQQVARSLVLLGPDIQEDERILDGEGATEQAQRALLERARVISCEGELQP